MPILAGATHADRLTVLGDVRHHHDLRAARDAPPLAENVEFDLAKAAGEGNLLRRRDVPVAKEDHAVLVVRSLDLGEGGVVKRAGQIDPADLGAEGGTGRNNLDGHRRLPYCAAEVRAAERAGRNRSSTCPGPLSSFA